MDSRKWIVSIVGLGVLFVGFWIFGKQVVKLTTDINAAPTKSAPKQ